MGESAEDIRKHIEALSAFESEYGEFIAVLEELRRTGQGRWSDEEFARRKRSIQMNAVRADRAIEASGVGGLVFTEPPAIGGGVRSADLPSQVFDFIEVNPLSGDDGLSFQRAILDRIPSQIAGLEMRLDEAESLARTPPERTERTKSDRAGREPRRFAWLNHTWTITIVGGAVAAVVGGAVLAVILGLFS